MNKNRVISPLTRFQCCQGIILFSTAHYICTGQSKLLKHLCTVCTVMQYSWTAQQLKLQPPNWSYKWINLYLIIWHLSKLNILHTSWRRAVEWTVGSTSCDMSVSAEWQWGMMCFNSTAIHLHENDWKSLNESVIVKLMKNLMPN